MNISKEKMQEIYEQIKTPCKVGAVIKEDDYLTDSPTVFKFNNKWYMYYIMINKDTKSSGYETHFASSDNLIDWCYEGKVFERSDDDSWDSKQIAGYVAFLDNNFGGSNEVQSVGGKYYISYLGGNLNGYETDPLSMGLAYSDSPVNKFTKFEKPIMSPHDADAREFETITLYKSNMFIDECETLGHKYINAYNAKAPDGKERIYLAVSDDAEHWVRYLKAPIIDETKKIKDLCISGDPQIVKIDDLYVMFFFRYIRGKGGCNTFACSYNLVDWTTWEGEPLVKSECEWENVLAHKSWVIKHNGVVYHYYCAVNDKGERFIALATSEQ